MVDDRFFYWDPNPELFSLPLLGWPILWYSALFALGFALGFPLFVGILMRYFLQHPEVRKEEILDPSLSADDINVDTPTPATSSFSWRERGWLHASSKPERAARRLSLEKIYKGRLLPLRRQAVQIADRLIVYMVVGTVLGARLGHFLFYERPKDYLAHWATIFKIPFEGLSSHGAALGISLALVLFARRIRDHSRGLTWLRLLDFVSVPAALAGCLIRIGNFFNQEILGTATQMPWAVVFGHPADHSRPIPRHPVQLYEAFGYLIAFMILYRMSLHAEPLKARGRLFGLFLILVFGSRWLFEFWKEEQSRLLPLGFSMTMGQILSIPAVILGLSLLLSSFRYQRPGHTSFKK